MSRAPKPPKFRTSMAEILSLNVDERMRAAFPQIEGDTKLWEALGRRSGVGKETVRQIIKGQRSPTVDTLAAIAQALATTTADLLSVAAAESASVEATGPPGLPMTPASPKRRARPAGTQSQTPKP